MVGDVNWGLLNVPDIGGAFRQGYDQKRQQNALAAYAQNPDNPQALNALAQVAPEFAIKQRQQQQELDLQRQRYLQPLQAKRDEDRKAYVGQAALRISQLPPEQRAAAWDQAVAQGVQMGHPELAQYAGRYDPELLNATLAAAGLTDKALEAQQPHYMVIPADGKLVDTRNPQAVAQFGASTAQAGGVQEGATATNPQTGQKIQFKGGQWVPMGGPQVAPAGTFRP